jgi:hypothetical protein
MAYTMNESFLEEVTSKMIKNRHVYGTILCVESGDGSLSWCGSAGDLHQEDRYFIASVTKMYITIVILQLKNCGHPGFSHPSNRPENCSDAGDSRGRLHFITQKTTSTLQEPLIN